MKVCNVYYSNVVLEKIIRLEYLVEANFPIYMFHKFGMFRKTHGKWSKMN
jgi:hypothetical protein